MHRVRRDNPITDHTKPYFAKFDNAQHHKGSLTLRRGRYAPWLLYSRESPCCSSTSSRGYFLPDLWVCLEVEIRTQGSVFGLLSRRGS
eukprot:2721049-Rhodomonas_salina.2